MTWERVSPRFNTPMGRGLSREPILQHVQSVAQALSADRVPDLDKVDVLVQAQARGPRLARSDGPERERVDAVGPLELDDALGGPVADGEIVRDDARAGLELALELGPQARVDAG